MEAQQQGPATTTDDAQVTIRLITRLPAQLHVPDTAVAVPATINRYGLSQIINALLELHPSRPFDFLVNDTLLRGSLAQCVETLKLSAEDVIDIEYVLAVLPPKPRAELPHDDWVSCLALPAGVLVSGAYDGCIRAWSTEVQAPLSVTAGAHEGPITALASFAVHNTTAGLISGGKDGHLYAWALPLHTTGRTTSTTAAPATLHASQCEDGLPCVGTLVGQGASVGGVAVSPSGRRCLGGGWDGSLRVWQVPDVSEVLEAQAQEEGGTQSQGSKRRGTLDSQRASLAETTPTGALSGHTDCVSAVCWPTPNTAVSGSWDHAVRLWDVQREEAVHTFHGGKAVYAVAPQPTGGHVVAFGGADNVLRLWDPRDKTNETLAVQALTSHRHWISGVAWRPGTEHQLVSCSHDKTIKLWDVRSDIPLHSVEGATDKLLAVLWLDSNRLAAGGADKQVHVFDLKPVELGEQVE